MSKTYIATFYSHFAAVRFHREQRKAGAAARMMPVPRDLSSSCGTAVCFEAELPQEPEIIDFPDPYGEIEQVVEKTESGYRIRYQAQNN